MKLTFTDSNFSAETDWIFKLKDNEDNTFYILNPAFYRQRNMKPPIKINNLDYCYKGRIIDAEVEEFKATNIVVSVFR
jgi:hypothetical protein